MTHVINGTEQTPKNSILIGLFNEFTKVPIKPYIFQRMTQPILQELALCILQELISYGPSRAHNLTLVLEETKANGKTVVIAQEEFPYNLVYLLSYIILLLCVQVFYNTHNIYSHVTSTYVYVYYLFHSLYLLISLTLNIYSYYYLFYIGWIFCY